MFKIGDFSRLSQVSVKTLRYYDDLGLLKPAHVDRFTSYRYYAADQLPRLNRILALKDLGFPLEQLARMLDDHLSPDQIRGMLHLRQAELQQQIEAEQARLGRVKARLHQFALAQEGIMSNYDVVLKKMEPQQVVALRKVIPAYHRIGDLFGELFSHLEATNVRPVGPAMGIYHDPDYREQDVDVEVAVPVPVSMASTSVEGTGLTVRELPAAPAMACVVHHGPYETISQAYGALMPWIEANGYGISGPSREVYLHGPGQSEDPATYVTEVQVPVERVSEAS